MTQQDFDFDHKRRNGYLIQIRPMLGRSVVAYLFSLARKIELAGGEAAFGRDELAHFCDCGVGTITEWNNKARAADVLATSNERDHGGNSRLVYTIEWAEIERLAKASWSSDEARKEKPSARKENPTARKEKPSAIKEYNQTSIKSTPPSSPNTTSLARPPGFEEEEARLKRLNVLTPGAAIDAGLGNGASLDDVRSIIDHFESQPGAWIVGLLKWRVEHACEAIGMDWPDPCEQYQRKDAAEYDERQRREKDQADGDTRRARQAERSRLDALEQSHGAELNRRIKNDDDDAWRALLTAVDGGGPCSIWSRYCNRPRDAVPRFYLLEVLAAASVEA